MRIFTPLFAIGVGLLLPGSALAQERPAGKPRNVLLIVADDLGLDLGCYGNSVIRTPNLDALAKNGVRFANGYATVSSCSPSRASLYTGLYTHQSGQYGLQHAVHAQQTFGGVMSLPRLLRAAGYFTGIIGKVHVGPATVYPWQAEITKGLGGNRDVVAMAQAARQFLAAAPSQAKHLVTVPGSDHGTALLAGRSAARTLPAILAFVHRVLG